MFWRILADATVWLHLLFILFVLLGAVLLLRWPRLVVLHLPALIWGVAVEWLHLYCPLTPLENHLRQMAGQAGYQGGFVEHYLIPLIYPAGLTDQLQLWLGGVVLLINAPIYLWLLWRCYRRKTL